MKERGELGQPIVDMGGSTAAGETSAPRDGALASADAIQRILSDLTRGILRPGAKLKVRELRERYGISATPLREALSQLAARGLVLGEDRRGFRVPPVSIEQLKDLTESRQIIEVEALRQAITHGNGAWEGEVLSSFHQLKLIIDQRDPSSEEWQESYERKHHVFHQALISACPLSSIKEFCDNLYVRMTRYRRLLKERGFSGENLQAAHTAIVAATLERNTEEATSLLRQHFSLPLEAVMAYLHQDKSAM